MPEILTLEAEAVNPAEVETVATPEDRKRFDYATFEDWQAANADWLAVEADDQDRYESGSWAW